MKLVDCYRLLGLREGASYEAVKAAYRTLARQYHPDANPGDRVAQETFVRIAQAYELLMAHPALQARKVPVLGNERLWTAASVPPASSGADPQECQLKQDIYTKLQTLLLNQRYPRAVALVEGLAQRLAADGEVRQWQAITYQHWARHLSQTQQGDKARVYLKKALRLVPENRTLIHELNQELERLERLT